LKTVRYKGYEVHVPRSWPVYDLSREPSVCVRFNRHAVYLGAPKSEQRCPAHAVGRTEAILLEPLSASGARSGAAVARAVRGMSVPQTERGQGSAGQVAVPSNRVLAIATWGGNVAVIKRALGVRSVQPVQPISEPSVKSHAPLARAAASAHVVFTGLGFDACSTPSSSTMSAWGASQYRAIGVYIGGTNMACSQPNLTSSWVAAETNAGWHLIPTYVGLQAPSNSCGCQGIAASQAQSEGTAAANDAAAHAGAVGIGPGNPIYFDMENYSRTTSNSSAVLTFLSAWTTQLHNQGYASGVYSNPGSGIADLVSRTGPGYAEPDHIWFANWNGQQSTSDPGIPSGDWAAHQRVHQYSGGHNETHGGATLNIDGDYLDAATVGSGTVSVGAGGSPSNYSAPSITGSAKVRNTVAANRGGWSGVGLSYSYRWQRCTPGCTNITHGTGQSYKLAPGDVGAMVRVVVTASNSSGSAQATTSTVGPVAPIGYWLYTARGGVSGSTGTLWLGSPASRQVRTSSVVGMASTVDGHGYWVVTSSGRAYAFGDAPKLTVSARGQRIAGIVSSPTGGYWLFTASGNVYRSSGARWFGSAAARHAHTPIVGMASTADGRGYWMVSSMGTVYAFGDAKKVHASLGRPVAGIAAAPRGGFWLFSAAGNVYRNAGAGFFGSPAGLRIRHLSVLGMASTADGRGYWFVSPSGHVYSFGDAARLSVRGGAIRGIAAQG
jgi:hypothetical protein